MPATKEPIKVSHVACLLVLVFIMCGSFYGFTYCLFDFYYYAAKYEPVAGKIVSSNCNEYVCGSYGEYECYDCQIEYKYVVSDQEYTKKDHTIDELHKYELNEVHTLYYLTTDPSQCLTYVPIEKNDLGLLIFAALVCGFSIFAMCCVCYKMSKHYKFVKNQQRMANNIDFVENQQGTADNIDV
jgi:hypothetical protein